MDLHDNDPEASNKHICSPGDMRCITDTRKCCRLHIDKGLRLSSVFHNRGHRFVDLVKVIMQLSGDLRNTAAPLKHNINTKYNIKNSRIRARRAFSDKADRRRLKQNQVRNQISERKIIYIYIYSVYYNNYFQVIDNN